MTTRSPSADLTADAKALEGHGFRVRVFVENGFDDILIFEYPVPAGYTKSRTDLLLRLPPSYRAGRPDMFWTGVDLLLANGTAPGQADTIERIDGMDWRRFSWHPSSWNPATDNLFTYLAFVDSRLSKRR